VRAARFHGANRPLLIESVPEPEPGPDEALVRVRAAGICGTELHFLEGLYEPATVPMTLGHEVAGVVEEVGPEATAVGVGDRVAVNYYLFCGRCSWCLRGRHNLCSSPRGQFAFLSDGGFAEYVAVPAHCLVPLPDTLPFESAATLCCSATTAIHAMGIARVEPGELVVVYGAGGVGLALVQVARIRGARVLAVSRSPEKLRAARELGADHADHPDRAAARVAELTRDGGADVVFELVGTDETMRPALGLLGKRGRLTFIGYSAESLRISPMGLVVAEQQILSSVGHTHPELEQAVGLAARGLLTPPVAGTVPLEGVNRGLDELRRNRVVGRLVVVP
jgi:alcohol dehydrogenase, propanol-preferring